MKQAIAAKMKHEIMKVVVVLVNEITGNNYRTLR